MESRRFDDLTKLVATTRISRTQALRVAAGAGLGAVLGLRTTGVAAQQGPCEIGNTFLCHKEANGPPNNAQCVEDSAVSAHLGHGDCVCGVDDCRCPTPSPGTECFVVAQVQPPPPPPPPGGRPGQRPPPPPPPPGVVAICPPGYTGNATSPCNGDCPCKRRRRCKNGRCCEKKGTHCNKGKECCSGRCKRIHDNHKQCA